MDSAIERIAVIQGAPGNAIEELIAAFIARWSSELRIAGVVAEDHGLPDRSCAAGYLTCLASGKRYSIFADLPLSGPSALPARVKRSACFSCHSALRKLNRALGGSLRLAQHCCCW